MASGRTSAAVAGLLTAIGCGYVPVAHGPGAPLHHVIIQPVRSTDASVDRAVVDVALARAVGRAPNLVATATVPDALRLYVRASVETGRVSALSEPRIRAARYDARVTLRGRAVDATGKTRWQGFEVGRTPFLSTPGGVESLDGASRRGLADAARQAAERLIRSLSAQIDR